MQLAAIPACAIDRFNSPIEQHTTRTTSTSRSSATSSIIMGSSDNDTIDSSSYAVYDRIEDTGSSSNSNSNDRIAKQSAPSSDIKLRLESSSSEIQKISSDKQQQEENSQTKTNNDVQCLNERQYMHYESTIEPITQHQYATTLNYDNNHLHHHHHLHHQQQQQQQQQQHQHYTMQHQYHSSNYCHYCNSQRPCYCDTQLADTDDLLMQQQDSYTCKNEQLGDVVDITGQSNVHYNRTQQQQQRQQQDHSDNNMISIYRNNNNNIFPQHQHHHQQQPQQFDNTRQQHRCSSTSTNTTNTASASVRSSSDSSATTSTIDGYGTNPNLRTPMLQSEPVEQHHYQTDNATTTAIGGCCVSNRALTNSRSTDSVGNNSTRAKSNDIQYQGEPRDQLHYETIASAEPITHHHYATTLNYDDHHQQQNYAMHQYNGSSYCHYCNNQRPCDCDAQLADTTDLLMQQPDSYGCKNQQLPDVIEMSDQSSVNYNKIQQQSQQQQDHGHNGVISIYRNNVFPQQQPQQPQQQLQQPQQHYDSNNRQQQHRCSSTSTANSTPTSTSVRSSPGTSATTSSIDGYAPPDSSLRIQLLQEPVLRHHFQANNSAKSSCDVSTSSLANKSGRRGRPRKKGQRSKNKVNGKLWEFIRDLLLNDRTNPSFIRWERREDGVFKFVQSDKVAKMWGERKQNPKMTYEKLSRAMRYYYKSKVLLPVFGRRLVYKFGPNATGWMST